MHRLLHKGRLKRQVCPMASKCVLSLLTLHTGLSASRNLEMWTVLALPPWSSGCCIQVRFSCAIKRHGLNIIMQGVIQKEPQSVPVVNNVRAMAAHGSRLLRQNHYHHDDFDL